MPLRALIDQKEFFAWNLTESDRKKGFLCPICKRKFIIVIPKQEERIKYFRHLVGKAHQENETEEHVKGKLKIIDIASKLGLKWDLEHEIGNHVTDVYIEDEQPLAIEFQCSKCNST
jgi:competence CoiA-like predicted nuclease